jgi:ABC-type transport system involved in multi-copper enzyme maturation permease subunit
MRWNKLERRMAVYKRRYAAYTGSLTPEWSRFFVLTRYAFADLFESRFFVLLLILTLVPTLFFAAYIFIANNNAVQLLLPMRSAGMFSVEAKFFTLILIVQTQAAFLLNCWVGPVLIAGDLTNGALPLFLSRPFGRAEYVLGKLAVLALLLSGVTWVPSLLLFSLEAGLAKGDWIWSNIWMVIPILLCSAIWILMLSLLSLAVSAWVKLRIVATGVIFITFFIPAGLGEMFNSIMGTYWGRLLNFSYMFRLIVAKGFGERPALLGVFGWNEIPVPVAWGVLIFVCLLSLVILNARLRAREAVRG